MYNQSFAGLKEEGVSHHESLIIRAQALLQMQGCAAQRPRLHHL